MSEQSPTFPFTHTVIIDSEKSQKETELKFILKQGIHTVEIVLLFTYYKDSEQFSYNFDIVLKKREEPEATTVHLECGEIEEEVEVPVVRITPHDLNQLKQMF